MERRDPGHCRIDASNFLSSRINYSSYKVSEEIESVVAKGSSVVQAFRKTKRALWKSCRNLNMERVDSNNSGKCEVGSKVATPIT